MFKQFLTLFRSIHGLRALQHHTYFVFLLGQFFVLGGIWMMDTARGWLVYEMTGDPRKLGFVVFAANAPILIMGLFTGTIVDKYNHQKLLSLTQFSLGLIGLVMFILTVLISPDGQPFIRYWHLVVLAFITGLIAMIDMPIRQSILVQMVPRTDLPNALALNSMIFNLTRIIGPSIAGIVIAKAGFTLIGFPMSGTSLCFLFYALFFLAVSIQTRYFKLASQEIHPPSHGILVHLKEGVHYCIASPHIGVVTIYTGLIALFALPYLTVLPVFAKDVFHGTALTLGRLMACVGIGALLGGVFMACIRSMENIMALIGWASSGFAVVMTLFAHSPSLILADIAILFAGTLMAFIMIGCQTVIQTLVSERFRGRVNAFYTVTAMGFMPIGGLLIGFLVHEFGPRYALTINSGCILLGSFWYNHYRTRLLKIAKKTPEYQQFLQIPEV